MTPPHGTPHFVFPDHHHAQPMSSSPPVIHARDIICIGVNPAFQTTLHFESFNKGKVNRAFKKTHSIGGKGQNVAIAIQQLGLPHQVCVLQFTGGMTGKYIRDALSEKQIAHLSIPVQKPTRTCTTVLDYLSNSTTEVIEPSASISHDELAAFQALAQQVLTTTNVRGMAMCGTFPTGVDGKLYQFLTTHKPKSCTLILDAYRGIESTLLSGHVDILKINCDEARALMNAPPTTPLIDVGIQIMDMYPIGNVAITQNASSAYLFIQPSGTCVHIYEYILPSLQKILGDHQSANGSGPLVDQPSNGDLFLADCNSPLAPRPRMIVDSHLLRKSVLKNTNNKVLVAPSNDDLHQIPSPVLADSEAGCRSFPDGTNVPPPSSTQLVLNPLGAGDTCSGVTLARFLESKDLVDAFAWGLSAASASCLMTETTAHFDVKVMNIVYQNVAVNRISPS